MNITHKTPGNLEQQQQKQQTASPSYPVSTAWDSRSSRRTNLPPCQREPASLPAALVHSREAVDSAAVITQHWQRDTELRVRRGWGGSPRLCSWAHLWISVTPLSSPLPLCFPPLSVLLWPHRFLFGPAHSCTRTSHLLPPPPPDTRPPPTLHTPPPPPTVFS